MNGTTFMIMEAEHRIGDHWKVSLEGHFFMNVATTDPLTFIDQDDFINLSVQRYF